MITERELAGRLVEVGRVLGGHVQRGRSLTEAKATLVSSLDSPRREVCFLLLAVVIGAIPVSAEVVELERAWKLDGAAPALESVIREARRRHRLRRASPIHVVQGLVIDVHNTASTPFTSGIQRVVRSLLPQWSDHDPLLVVWTADGRSLRRVSPGERARAQGEALTRQPDSPREELVVPFRARLVLPEIAVETRRAMRLQSIAQNSGSFTAAIGHDCIPITTAETAGAGMPGGFAKYLSALAAFDIVSPTSGASAAEFSGWRRSLSGTGLTGPEIRRVGLPSLSSPVIPKDESELRAELGIAEAEPVVAVVGSHEPRKNHLAVLAAAETLWRRGRDFSMVMVGGNSWDTLAFDRAVSEAKSRGRHLVTLTAADDETVWGLYRMASFSLFPSVNEGFGLPVVESIAAGTPVITSNYGSMAELADGVGGLLVDPRDDAEIAAAMELLLGRPDRLAALASETSRLSQRTWAEYAAELATTFGVVGA